jgi:alpha-1,3/alpha-1,6-mannosyltransferase
MPEKAHTVFFHPDLGIGGAERLVIDAAVALQERGHKVTIFTSHCDKQHCFDEARDGKAPQHLTTTTQPLIYGRDS